MCCLRESEKHVRKSLLQRPKWYNVFQRSISTPFGMSPTLFLLLDFTKITTNKVNPRCNQANPNILLCESMIYEIYFIYIHKHFARLLPVHCVTTTAALLYTSVKMGKGAVNHKVYKLPETFFRTASFFYTGRTCIKEISSEEDANNIADYFTFYI